MALKAPSKKANALLSRQYLNKQVVTTQNSLFSDGAGSSNLD